MKGNEFKSLPEQSPVPVRILPYDGQDDEVDFRSIWRLIARRKAIILLSLLAALVVASIYVFYSQAYYRAQTRLLAPQRQYIQGLLIDYKGLEQLDVDDYSPERVFEEFLKNLKSYGPRREFFDHENLVELYVSDQADHKPDPDRIFAENFDSSMEIQVDKQDQSFVTASLVLSDAEQAAQMLNRFVDFVDKRTIEQLYANIDAIIRAEIDRVRYQIQSRLKLAAQTRRDRMTSLQEALIIAKALDIEGPSGTPLFSGIDKLEIAVNTEPPLYLRGAKALEAEIAVLQARKSDEPFIDGLRQLQDKLVLLESISIDKSTLSAVTIDSAARIPYEAETPKVIRVFMLAAMGGLILGVFFALIRELAWTNPEDHGANGRP
jgi:chain length determinant protein (polysaccharide antigen chain regulator)